MIRLWKLTGICQWEGVSSEIGSVLVPAQDNKRWPAFKSCRLSQPPIPTMPIAGAATNLLKLTTANNDIYTYLQQRSAIFTLVYAIKLDSEDLRRDLLRIRASFLVSKYTETRFKA